MGSFKRKEKYLYIRKCNNITLESRIIGGVGIIGGLDIVISINNMWGGGGGIGIIGGREGLSGVEKIV